MSKTCKKESAFKETDQHRGLSNKTGENNCFLNVTIQALWHLGPFRAHLQQLISVLENQQALELNALSKLDVNSRRKKSLLTSLCHLFIQYQFTEQDVLPPNELRESLSCLSAEYELGKIADAAETLDLILQRIHCEFDNSCPNERKCLAHTTFGGIVLEQSICHLCGASSEPAIRNNFLLYFQAAEILQNVEKIYPPVKVIGHEDETGGRTSNFSSFFNFPFLFKSHSKLVPPFEKISKKAMEQMLNQQLLKSKQFGMTLQKCIMSVGGKSCPSVDEAWSSFAIVRNDSANAGEKITNTLSFAKGDSYDNGNLSETHSEKEQSQEKPNFLSDNEAKRTSACSGPASVFFFSLDPPLILALSISWTNSRETSEKLLKFFSSISSIIYLKDLFCEDVAFHNRVLPPLLRAAPNKPQPERVNSNVSSVQADQMTIDQEFLHKSTEGPAYLFRDSITSSEETYLLFDDHRIRPIGRWQDAVKYCVSSCYQPVLLLYELEKNSATYSLDKIHQDYSSINHFDSCHQTEGMTTDPSQDNTLAADFPVASLLRRDPKEIQLEILLKEKMENASCSPTDDEESDCNDTCSVQIMSMDTIDEQEKIEAAKSQSENEKQLHDVFREAFTRQDNLLHLTESGDCKVNELKDSTKSTDNLLDLYTENGRNKLFWRKYYDARYGESFSEKLGSSTESQPIRLNHDSLLYSRHYVDNIHQIDYAADWNREEGVSLTSSNIPSQNVNFAKYNVQSIITVWGRRPYRYHISVPLVSTKTVLQPLNHSDNRVTLGIVLDLNERNEVFVTDFYKHPQSGATLPAELSGKIQLMDQLLAINGELLEPLLSSRTVPTTTHKLSRVHQLLNTLQEPFVLLAFQSSAKGSLWYQCPNCCFTNEILPEREAILKKQLLDRIQRRKIRKNDNSNTHSIQNYGIYFTCGFCKVKSFCQDYLPDLMQ